MAAFLFFCVCALHALSLSAAGHDQSHNGDPCGDVKQYLSPIAIPGLHVICVKQEMCDVEGGMRLTVWEKARSRQSSVVDVVVHMNASRHLQVHQVVKALESKLRIKKKGKGYNEPALYRCSDGVKMQRRDAFADYGTSAFCFYEGGVFIWPPGVIGSMRFAVHGDGQRFAMRTLSISPIVFEVQNFIKQEECEHIKTLALPQMQSSPVKLIDADKGKDATEWRTSSQAHLLLDNDDMLLGLTRRVETVSKLPASHARGIQVLKYEKMQHYASHYDFFDPELYKKQPEIIKFIKNGARNRFVTVFFYLSDVEKGGHTNFPLADGGWGSTPPDYFDCSRGLSVKPERGKVILFYNMHANGELDKSSLHGGCDVLEGTKLSANYWLYSQKFDP